MKKIFFKVIPNSIKSLKIVKNASFNDYNSCFVYSQLKMTDIQKFMVRFVTKQCQIMVRFVTKKCKVMVRFVTN